MARQSVSMSLAGQPLQQSVEFAAWLEELDDAMNDMDTEALQALRTAIARAHATGDVQEAAEWFVREIGVTPNETP
jgi:truncated hemoglobin YjbI